LDVQLDDASFSTKDFETVAGSLNVKWERVAPGSNVSHVVVLRPLSSGYYNFSSAEVTYQSSDNAVERKFGYTSAPGEEGIVNFRDYDRKFSPHVLDWAAFAVMTLPSLGIPFLLWYSSKSKYDKPKPKRN
jgi:translocon-associated protein subunit beta